MTTGTVILAIVQDMSSDMVALVGATEIGRVHLNSGRGLTVSLTLAEADGAGQEYNRRRAERTSFKHIADAVCELAFWAKMPTWTDDYEPTVSTVWIHGKYLGGYGELAYIPNE